MRCLLLIVVSLMGAVLLCVDGGFGKKHGYFALILKAKLKTCYTTLRTCKKTSEHLESELSKCNQTLEKCSGTPISQCADLEQLFNGEPGITINPKTETVNSADISCENAATGEPLIFMVTCTQLADGSLDWVNTAIPITDSQNLLSVVQDACNSPFGR